jgi:hypothetical protein
MIPTLYNLPDAYRGDSYGPITFVFTDANSNPINMSGVSVIATIGTQYTETNLYQDIIDYNSQWQNIAYQWNTDNKTAIVTGASGNNIVLNALSGSQMMMRAGAYYYAVQIISGQSANTYIAGNLNVYDNANLVGSYTV